MTMMTMKTMVMLIIVRIESRLDFVQTQRPSQLGVLGDKVLVNRFTANTTLANQQRCDEKTKCESHSCCTRSNDVSGFVSPPMHGVVDESIVVCFKFSVEFIIVIIIIVIISISIVIIVISDQWCST